MALIGILAALIADPLSICVDDAAAAWAPNTAVEFQGSAGDRTLDDQSSVLGHDCSGHATYIRQQSTADMQPKHFLYAPLAWTTPIIGESGVERPRLRAQTNYTGFFSASFEPRAPPFG